MNLSRSDSPVRPMNGAVNRLLGDILGDLPVVATGIHADTPFVDLWEDGDHVYAELDLPGCSMKDIEVLVHNKTLRIHGRREPGDREGFGWLRRERLQGSFERVLPLPYHVDADRVKATLKSGVLHVDLPKSEHEKPRRIDIQALPES